MCCSCCNCCKKPEMVTGVITKSIPLRVAYSMPKVNLEDIGSGLDSYSGSSYSDPYSGLGSGISPYSGLGSGISPSYDSVYGGVDPLSGISTRVSSGCCCCN